MIRIDQIRGARPWLIAGAAATVLLMLAQSTGNAQPLQIPGTVLAAAAMRAGIRRCYSMIDVVSNATFANAQHADVVLDWNRAYPDGEPFYSLSGLDYGHAAALVSMTTAPVEGGCSVLVERISSAPLRCSEVAHSELAGYRATPLVPAVTVYSNPARPRETVTLLDSPSSCVIVRRQVRLGSPDAR